MSLAANRVQCEVIEDLLPLYADKACSQQSLVIVEEHVTECDACRGLLVRMKAEIMLPPVNDINQHEQKAFRSLAKA